MLLLAERHDRAIAIALPLRRKIGIALLELPRPVRHEEFPPQRRPLEKYLLGLYPRLHATDAGDGVNELGLGLGVFGQSRVNHFWSFGGAPVFETGGGEPFGYSHLRASGSGVWFGPRGRTL
ncbi:MAG: hypothetical protein HY703_08975 [Gemmatimonadetes bacterium]|nr:hypothetical protein [Gemmatimonadota bacterium]